MRFPRFFGAGTPADAGSSPFPLAAKAVVEHEKIVFIALILLYLLPLWFFPFFPTQDGGSHLFNAEVIRQYHDPSRTDLRKHFDLTNDLDPYWTSNLVLGALLSIVPPLIAEKLLVTLYLVLFPVSLRYLVKSIRPDAAYAAWLVLPVLYNWWLHMGFYNYCLAFVPYVLLVGYWFRHAESPGMRKIPVIAGLSILIYFTHPGASVMLCITLALLAAWSFLLALVRAPAGRRWAAARSNLLSRCDELLALAPFAILLRIFLVGFMQAPPRQILPAAAHTLSWSLLRDFYQFVSFRDVGALSLRALFYLFALLLADTAVRRCATKRLDRSDGFLLVLVADLILFFLLTWFELVSVRVLLFAVVAAIAFFASVPRGKTLRGCVQLCVIALSIAMVSSLMAQYRRLNVYWKDVVSCASHLEPGRTLLYLCLEQRGLDPAHETTVRFFPMRHIGNYLAVEKRMTSMNDYEATERFMPVQYKQQLNPYTQLAGYQESDQPGLDLLAYSAKTGASIDYVVVWGATPENLQKPFGVYMIPQLFNGYDMIYKTPMGVGAVFRKKPR